MSWLRINSTYRQNDMNDLVFLTHEDVAGLANDALTGSIFDAFYKEWPEWTNSFIYFPFSIVTNEQARTLKLGKNFDVGTGCRYVDPTKYNTGFTLGEYKHTPSNNDFTDFEPYTQFEVYLPYYGYTTLKIADIYNKYVQFRLFIDFYSGAATYYIGVTDVSSDSSSINKPFRGGLGSIDEDMRIIGTYACQLGVPIPIGQSGASEAIRNILLGVVKGTATIAGAYVGGLVGAGISNSITSSVVDSTVTTRELNPATGRLRQTSSVTRHYDQNYNRQVERNTWKLDVTNGCFNTAANAIVNANISPHFDRSNNPFSDSIGPNTINVVIKRVNIKDVDSEYAHLYGQPLGEQKVLREIHGYTECAAIHLEGSGFGSATTEEIKLITQLMSSGVILP